MSCRGAELCVHVCLQRGATHAREPVCVSLLPPHNTTFAGRDDPGKRLQQGTGKKEFRCCSQALRLTISHTSVKSPSTCSSWALTHLLHQLITTRKLNTRMSQKTWRNVKWVSVCVCVCVRARAWVCVCNVHSQHMATEAKYSLSTAGSCFLLLTLDPSQSGSLFSLLPSNMLSSAHPPLLGVLSFPLHFSLSPFLD